MRRHRATGGTHRDAALPSSAVKVGVLGALATATIAAPLAASAAGIDESAAAPDASGLPRTETTTATAATPVALPATEADGEQQQAASADVETRADDAASRDQDRTEPQDDAAGEDGSAQEEDAATGIEVEVPEPEPEPEPAEPEDGDASGEAEAADASGEAPSAGSGGYVQPVSGSISSGYGYRTHPVLGTSKLHEGVDFAVGCGTPVKSAQSGTVVAVEYHSASGKRVKVDHGNGTITGYYHLQGYNTSVGATVEAGEVIGYVGTTGRSTGCHLHFAKMDESGAYSNPMSLLR